MRFRLQHHKQRNQAKNSTLIVGRFRRLVFSVRAAWENPSCGTGWITTARTKSGDVQNAKSRCQNRTMLLIYSPVFRLRGQHDPAMGRLNLARYRSLGQGKLPAPERTVLAAALRCWGISGDWPGAVREICNTGQTEKGREHIHNIKKTRQDFPAAFINIIGLPVPNLQKQGRQRILSQ